MLDEHCAWVRSRASASLTEGLLSIRRGCRLREMSQQTGLRRVFPGNEMRYDNMLGPRHPRPLPIAAFCLS